jgi:uncharacterized repeat protein (TIGR03803 family)
VKAHIKKLFELLVLITVLVLPAFGAQAAVVLTTLYSFNLAPGSDFSVEPDGALVQGSDGNLYGTTAHGGAYVDSSGGTGGTVFKIGTNGTLSTLYSFTGSKDGRNPNGLVQGSDGNLYGTTSGNGTNGFGTVFKITTNGALTTLYSFGSIQDTNGVALDGANPNAALVQGSDGNFYGTTRRGGTNGGWGTVFKISTNGVLVSLYSFGSVQDTNGFPTLSLDGTGPHELVQGSDGNFYGTTECNAWVWLGSYPVGNGTVFKISPNGALTTLYAFGSITNASGVALDGEQPYAGLVQGNDGYLYGTTHWGGTNDSGTVFKISTNGALTTLYSFGSIQDTNGVALDGANPNAALVQGSDGNFYGTTFSGGNTNANYSYGYGGGTVFKISPSGKLTTLYSFGSVQDTNGAPLDGANPQTGLVQGNDGYLYGTTLSGGTNDVDFGGGGTVFRLAIVPDPQLSIIPSGPYIIISWPTNFTGYILQTTPNLVSQIWTTNLPAPVVVNGQYTVTNPISGTQQFFRLAQ